MKYHDSLALQIAYVIYALAAIGSMIDSPFYSAHDRANGYIFGNLVLIIWSLYMFGTGFVRLANDVNSKKEFDHRIYRSAAIRMILAAIFGIGAQWFFVQVMMDYLN